MSKPMTEQEAVIQWLKDIQAYNDLKAKDDALVDHVTKYCIDN